MTRINNCCSLSYKRQLQQHTRIIAKATTPTKTIIFSVNAIHQVLVVQATLLVWRYGFGKDEHGAIGTILNPDGDHVSTRGNRYHFEPRR